MMSRTRIYMIFILMILILGVNSGCVKKQEEEATPGKETKKRERFLIVLIPEKNIFEQRRRYRYITDYLSEKLGLDVQAQVLPSYSDICDAFLDKWADAGFFGSFSYVLTHAKAGVEPVARPVWLNGSSTYRGYIFVRKDSGINTVEDMKGKRLALVHKATTAGYIFQLAYFKRYGIKNLEDYFPKIYFAGSHDASAWAVFVGEADIGGGKNHIFNSLAEEYPDFKEQMLILAQSPSVPSNGLAVRADLDPVLKKRIKDLLLNLDKTEEGRGVLQSFEALRFVETRDEDYAPLYNMVKELEIDLKTYSN